MLSILIPVYNFDVTNFVTDLHTLCKQEKITFEIILFDDASNEDFKNKNRLLQKLPFVTYQELTQNIGRSAIRNKLAEAANYDFLMFVDCDSKN
jgi:glycosyltransferase involved in cell wall biosynthesis